MIFSISYYFSNSSDTELLTLMQVNLQEVQLEVKKKKEKEIELKNEERNT